MTVAHPGADYCAHCMLQEVLTRAMEWPGAPACRRHVSEFIARANGEPVIVATLHRSSQSASLH
jgi:hypothetical protein